MPRHLWSRSLIIGATMLALGCGSGMMDGTFATELVSVTPAGGATGVSATPDIVLAFSRSMMPGMEQFVALHQGGVTGLTTSMRCSWSDRQKTLTCRPDAALAPGTRYTVHVGGGMMDADGQSVGMDRYGMKMGGQCATAGMMDGRGDMMGAGWGQANGFYGMMFEFVTS
ncbi:MAG: Ig-like domain-containing protein [Gemmatimonadales bacterium]|nr:Ig-like domain-containing protein [Gemmatimonadales bacterium]